MENALHSDLTKTPSSLCQEITSRLKERFPQGAGLHEPVFSGNELAYLKECLDSTFVSSVGPFVDRLETELAAFVGVKRAVAVANGTSALHICLELAGVGPGDEVLIPALTFVATANAVLYSGATPHFVDSEEKTLGIDADKLEAYLHEVAEVRGHVAINRKTGRPLRALVVMHTFGIPSDLDRLDAVCEKFRLVLVEDAAESLGSTYKGRHTGSVGRLSALSFNGNKIATSGGGGAVLTNDLELGRMAKHITTTAKVPHRWAFVHDRRGYNYRMPNLNAALACAQLEQVPKFVESKRRLHAEYARIFENLKGARLHREPASSRGNCWLNALILDTDHAHTRDEILNATNDAKVMTRPFWTLMSKLEFLQEYPKMDLSQAESLEARTICIPSSSFLWKEPS